MITSKQKQGFFLLVAMFMLLIPEYLSAQNSHDMDVTVNDVDGQDKIVFLHNSCPTNWQQQNGCILKPRGQSGLIRWNMNNGNGWGLTRLMLSPDGVHWGDPAYPLPECVRGDFSMTNADMASGQVSSAQAHGGGQLLSVRMDDTCSSDYYVHYRIFAANGVNEIDSDPIISNGGRPGNN